MIQKTTIGIFSVKLEPPVIHKIIESWLERFDGVEQLVPTRGAGDYTLAIKSPAELMVDPDLQFRVHQGPDFAWVYLSLGRQAIETTSLPSEEISLGLEVLLELPGLTEIVDGRDEKRQEELEREGLL